MSSELSREQNSLSNHELFIRNEFIDFIMSGSKSLEVRPSDRFTQSIKQGDAITFKSQARSVNVKVRAVRSYKNVSDVLKSEPVSAKWPGQTENGLLEKWNEIYSGRSFNEILVFEIELGRGTT